MNAEMLARSIELIIAPVVMITACALLAAGLLNRYATLNDRMRLLARERFDLLRPQPANETSEMDLSTWDAERLVEIDKQLPDLVRRHKMIHDALLAIYTAIAFFVIAMFLIALVVIVDHTIVTTGALLAFLAGMLALLWAVVLVVIEVRNSHLAVQYEVNRVLALDRSSISKS